MKKTNKKLIVMILISCLFLCIGYAEITNTKLEITGSLEAIAQTEVFIADVATSNATSVINGYIGTMLDTKTILGTASSSTVNYNISLYNNSDKNYVFIGVVKDESLYNNPNIEYILTGITEYETIIAPHSSLDFTLTFKYKEGASTGNNILESTLNFRFREKPEIELSNEGEKYTLENIYPGYTPQEYKFKVTNINKEIGKVNNVPIKYSFETTLEGPIKAEIYEGTNLVTGDVLLEGEKEYTLKIVWDESKNNESYANKEYTCNVKIKAIPTDIEYEGYNITKEFNINIKTSSFYFNVNTEVTDITMENNEASINLSLNNYNSNTEYNTFDTNYEIYLEDTSKFNLSLEDINNGVILGGVKTNNITAKISLKEGQTIDEAEEITVKIKTSKPYEKEISKKVTIELTSDKNYVATYTKDNVPIPTGFYYVGGVKSTGIVISDNKQDEYGAYINNSSYDSTFNYTASQKLELAQNVTDVTSNLIGNQFVWVPVSNPDTFTTLTKGWSNGVEQIWVGTEPKVTLDDGDAENISAILEADKYSDLSTQFTKEYNDMVESVKVYGGFYVGCYETSWTGTKVASVGNVVPMQASTDLGSTWITGRYDNKASWYGLYAKQKELYNKESDSVVSGMIYGCQWDAIMNWMKDIPNNDSSITEDINKFYIKNSTGMGVYAGDAGPLVTGQYKVNNIYDLAGNYIEWTQEAGAAGDISSRVSRGGNSWCDGSGDPASCRYNYDYPTGDYNYSSRLQLYIKTTEQEVPTPTPQEDELAGTWVFNEILTFNYDFSYNVSFIANGITYNMITASWEPAGYILDFESKFAYSSNEWISDVYKTITITTKLSEMENGEEFLTWLKTNATKQEDNPSSTKLISFTVSSYNAIIDKKFLLYELNAEEGMNWLEWVESEYNTCEATHESFSRPGGSYIDIIEFPSFNDKFVMYYSIPIDADSDGETDIIQDGYDYVVDS